MYVCLNMDGKDKVGLSYLLPCISMAKDKGLFKVAFASRSLKQKAVYAVTA